MFYFLIPTLMSYNFFLIAAAVIPALFLMLRAYRSDKLEKESGAVLWSLTKAGVFSSLIALVEERVLCFVLDRTVSKESFLYNIILYFGIVAFAEESSKYLMLRRRSWRSREFNCQYDGVIYAVFVSLGFALWENISYVMTYGVGTAIVRAVTAIPGHACFGVFMGVFYGFAKRFERSGDSSLSRFCRWLAVIIPALLHGAYDYIATSQTGNLYFLCFVVALFVVSYILVGKMSKRDSYI
ncbi:MAG: PrsW family intramembrane metalloprotease [Clostridia bacterium]|nr:PrsW family intramembrane metalloprotease [Clostridia bacterium]